MSDGGCKTGLESGIRESGIRARRTGVRPPACVSRGDDFYVEKCGVSREAAPANFPGLKILCTEAVEQWQEHITGTHPMSASLIVRLHR